MYYLAAALVVVSGLTDCIDGYIARHYNMITDLGKIVDPLADKLTQITIVACLVYRYRLMWVLVGLLVFKELFVSLMGFAVMRTTNVVEGSRWYGKLATIIFYLIIVMLLVLDVEGQWANALILLCIAGMSVSLVLYTVRYARILISAKKDKQKIDT